MRLELQVALSLLHRGSRHSLGPDRSQVADLHLPDGPGPHPVAVLLHGGYWQTKHGRLGTRPLALDLARRGVAAWNLEYRRLGDGRGGGGGWPMTFDDVAEGIDALASVDAPASTPQRTASISSRRRAVTVTRSTRRARPGRSSCGGWRPSPPRRPADPCR